ncbi:hypothetical protein CP533_0475 [Ophiocordyceps camponoti-saundersi (nom. inval.)]|nr:hypothetical protein CP533_0475 [Ophiocordyceps camponoti-saundersi (nom. inval.)]
MSGVIEALHIYDDSRISLLSHTFTGRPLSAAHLLPLYLEHPAPRPSLLYLPNSSPPTLVFSLVHANLLLLATSSADIEPLLALEFLHRVVDALEDFLGSPLLAVKIEANYHVVAQLLTEMCDAGTVCTTEPNALREVVEMEGWVGKLLGSINLPGKTPLGSSFAAPPPPSLTSPAAPALPWRRANVRHTSNELYADIVETLSVTLAPSGRPLAAFANGTIAFTAKVSGLPDITVSLTSPSGKHNIGSVLELPVFHPCVRLNRWRERPGELSFVPPDGRFTLAGYEVDLLPFTGSKSGGSLKLPIDLEMRTSLGSAGSEFEVRVQVNKSVLGSAASASQFGRGGGGGGGGGGIGGAGSGRLGAPHPGSPGAPLLDDLKMTIPLPEGVRNLSDIRPSKGDASFNPGERILEWHVPAKELAGLTCHAGLRCTVVGPLTDEEERVPEPSGFGTLAHDDERYDDAPYQTSPTKARHGGGGGDDDGEQDASKMAQNKILMPSSASASFSVRGWLASGLKVDGIAIDTRSRGLGEGVKPYKGVKYLTAPSRQRWRSTSARPRTAIFFPGQGTQKVGMLTPWLEAFPASATELIEAMDHAAGYKLSEVIQNGPSKLLSRTTNAQPAIMATSIVILRILEREYGFRVEDHFDVTLGHSLGEFAALVAGGYMAFEDSLYLVQRRAEAMSEATQRAVRDYGGEYGMVAVITEPEHLTGLIDAIDDFVGHSSTGSKAESSEDVPPIEQVLIANINSKNQIVLSGNMERIKTLIAHVRQFLGHDPRAVRLHSDSPFHSPIMKPAVATMRALLAGKSRAPGREGGDLIRFPATLPCISNVTARPFGSKDELKDLLARGCLETVRWWDCIKYLDQQERVRRWVGIGPGKVGRNLVGKEVGVRGRDLVKGGGVWAITDPSEVEEVLRGLEETDGLVDEEDGSGEELDRR